MSQESMQELGGMCKVIINGPESGGRESTRKSKVLGLRVRICMGVEGPKNVGGSPCRSLEVHASQKSMQESHVLGMGAKVHA
jgi:hypothetical protein